MAIRRIYRSAATVSWIDPATGLPEVDHAKPNHATCGRGFLTGRKGYRFCNFTEVWVEFDTTRGTIAGKGFSSESKQYVNTSYKGIPVETYPEKRDIRVERDAVVFTQSTCCRTHSPEVLGAEAGRIAGVVGGLVGIVIGEQVGKRVAHSFLGFPPIWSEIQIKIFNNGHSQILLGRHSYFPSLTFYMIKLERDGKESGQYDRVSLPPGNTLFYDAISNLDRWKKNGWGPASGAGSWGPTDGNPWGIKK